MTAQDEEFVRVINGVRLDLEVAGNPAHVVAMVGPGDVLGYSPIYATISSAGDHAQRLSNEQVEGERILVVSRSLTGRRAVFSVAEAGTLRRLFRHVEVVEETYAEAEEGPV